MKNVVKTLLVILLSFIFSCNVFADELDIHDVLEEFNKLELRNNDSLLIALFDDESNYINIVRDDKILLSLNYNDKYIEFDNKNFIVDYNNYINIETSFVTLEGFLRSVFKLSGYEDMMIVYYDNNVIFSNYGFEFDLEDFEFKIVNEQKENIILTNNILKYYKISLDGDLIDELINDCGVNVSKLNRVLEVDNVTNSSITFHTEVTDDDYIESGLICNIYRSDSLDGNYELISGEGYLCNNKKGFVDYNLKSDTSYYYKFKVVGFDEYSDAIKVTTLKDGNVNSNYVDEGNEINTLNIDKSDNFENPNTWGSFIYYIVGILFGFLMLVIGIFKYLNAVNDVI